MHKHKHFLTCCEEMHHALTETDESAFRMEDGILYLTVGSFGEGLLDRAVMYCPFCGQQLQTTDDLQNAPRPVN